MVKIEDATNELLDREIYEGLLLAVVGASCQKVRAGLRYAASGEHQAYPPGCLELGVVLDGLAMIETDIVDFIAAMAEETMSDGQN